MPINELDALDEQFVAAVEVEDEEDDVFEDHYTSPLSSKDATQGAGSISPVNQSSRSAQSINQVTPSRQLIESADPINLSNQSTGSTNPVDQSNQLTQSTVQSNQLMGKMVKKPVAFYIPEAVHQKINETVVYYQATYNKKIDRSAVVSAMLGNVHNWTTEALDEQAPAVLEQLKNRLRERLSDQLT